MNAQIFIGINPIQTIRHHLTCGAMQLRRQFNSRRSSANNRHLQLLRSQLTWLRMRTNTGIDHLPMKARRIISGLQFERMLGHPRRTEIIALTADGHDQCIVLKDPLPRHLSAILVQMWGNMHLFFFTI